MKKINKAHKVTIGIITFGCPYNKSDSEFMARLILEKAPKYKVIMLNQDFIKLIKKDPKQIEFYDLFIINTCVVKQPTINKIIRLTEFLDKNNKKIIIAGCAVNTMPELFSKYNKIGVYDIDKINEVVNATLKSASLSINSSTISHNNSGHYQNFRLRKLIKIGLECEETDRNNIRYYKVISIVPISMGCLGNCSYCETKLAKPKLISLPKQDIVNYIRKELEYGAKEFWLTSQDVGCYGMDINTNIVELLDEILSLDAKFKIRLGMMNPQYAKRFSDDLIRIYNNSKMFKFIHIPLQSGSNKILKIMRRQYKVKDFVELVEKLRSGVKNITISTDIICGFPGESEEDFNKTVEVVKTIKPDIINISRFWPMKNTEAARMKQLSGSVIKNRSKKLTELFKKISYENNKKWIGWQGECLVDEYLYKDKDGHNVFLARNSYYKPIKIKSRYNLLGMFVKVKITGCSVYQLIGEVIQRNSA